MSSGFRGMDHMVLLLADKVMVDEVAHEWGLEGGARGYPPRVPRVISE